MPWIFHKTRSEVLPAGFLGRECPCHLAVFPVLAIISLMALIAGMATACVLQDSDEGTRLSALRYAAEYAHQDTEYHWGAQDPLPRTIQLDCSGFVVRCYQYAAADHGRILPFADASVQDLYSRWSTPIPAPAPGDLIFMGAAAASIPTHIALFEHMAGDAVFFYDCTIAGTIDGVSLRTYPVDDPRIKSFGRMLLY